MVESLGPLFHVLGDLLGRLDLVLLVVLFLVGVVISGLPVAPLRRQISVMLLAPVTVRVGLRIVVVGGVGVVVQRGLRVVVVAGRLVVRIRADVRNS